MDISKLREALGAAKDIPDEQVIQQATAKLAAVPALETDKATALSRVTAAEAERDDWKKKAGDNALALSRATPAKPTARELYLSAKMFRQEKEKAVEGGALTQEIADKIEKRFLGSADTNALTLSRDVTDADLALARGLDAGLELFELLQGNKPLKGSYAPGGVLVLGRQVYGNPGDGTQDTAAQIEEGRKEADAFQKRRQQERGFATA